MKQQIQLLSESLTGEKCELRETADGCAIFVGSALSTDFVGPTWRDAFSLLIHAFNTSVETVVAAASATPKQNQLDT